MVLDDLQWADEPSLRLLGFLARALAAEPMALLGAYRDTEASPELRKIAGQAQQLALAGLTQDGVAELARELAGTPLPPQVTAQLWERSGGNPFFVRELIRLLLAQGSWHQPVQIPASVAETLRRRLARLSTKCVRLLEWAAIAGRDIDVGLLADGAAAGHEPAALSLLEEARQAGVVAGTSLPRFTHDLYREAIIEGLSATAGVITAAALLMIAVFGAFAFARVLVIRLLGFGLAAAVLVDATVIRLVLVPAVMQLAGPWNWWPGVRRLP